MGFDFLLVQPQAFIEKRKISQGSQIIISHPKDISPYIPPLLIMTASYVLSPPRFRGGLLLYIPRNSFFFASNSSCVMAPESRSALSF